MCGGRLDPKWGEVPVAFVAAKDPAVTAEELIDRVGVALGRFKRPKEIRFIDYDAFPRNAAGKIVKSSLKQHLESTVGGIHQ